MPIAASAGIEDDISQRVSMLMAGLSAIQPRRVNAGSRAPRINAVALPLLASFVAPPPDSVSTRIGAIRLVILACVLAGDVGPPVKVVADGLRKARGFPADWGALLMSLPEPLGSDWLVRLADAAERSAQALRARGGFSDRAQLRFLASLLALTQQTRGGLDRTISDFERVATPYDEGVVVAQVLEPGPIEADDPPAPASPRLLWIPEHEGGFVESRVAIDSASQAAESPESRTTESASARANVYRLTQLEQRLRWAWEHLNAFEVKLLQTRVLEGLRLQEPGAVLCALMLSTGQSAADVAEFGTRETGRQNFSLDVTAGTWSRPIPRPENAWKPPAAGHPALEPVLARLTLPVASCCLDLLRVLAKSHPEATTVGELLGCQGSALAFLSDWLDPLRKEHPNARLTQGRITAAINVELRAELADDAAVFILASRPGDIAPTSLYYTSYAVQRLLAAYGAALERVLGKPTKIGATAGTVGSQLTLTDRAVRDFILSLKTGLTKAAASNNPLEQHNRYVAYLLWMLLLATGHRPGFDPFEALDLFDLDAGFVAINDKMSFQGRDGRIVPLPPLVLEQLDHYRSHLRRLQAYCEETGRLHLSARLTLALEGKVGVGFPLLFLLDERTGKDKRIGRAEIAALMGPLEGLNTNFARHRFSQVATRAGLNREAIAETMGHIDNAEAALGHRSPLSTAILAEVGVVFEADLRSIGFEPAASPLPDRRSGEPSRKPVRARPLLLGTALRDISARSKRKDARQRAGSAIRMHVQTLDKPPNQKAIDAVFSEILHGKAAPRTLSDVVAHDHACRLLRALKYRKGWPVTLPASHRLLDQPPSQFAADSPAKTRLARTLREKFFDVLSARARLPSRAGTASRDRRAAEAIVSMVLHSCILDVEVIASLIEGPRFTALDAGALGIFLDTCVVNRSGQVEPRRYRLHPLTALLALQCGSRAQPATSCKSALLQLIERVGGDAGAAPGFPPRTSARSVAEWLTDAMRFLVRLEFPGHVAAFLEGVNRPVGLGGREWMHVVTGRVPKEGEDTGPADGIVSAPAAVDLTATALKPHAISATAGEARRLGLKFHREVVQIVDKATRPGGGGKEVISIGVRRLREGRTDLPDTAQLASQWLEHLAAHGSSEGPLAGSSCVRYYYALAPRLMDVLADTPLLQLSAEAIEMAYSSFMESVPEEGQQYVFNRLQEFHRFLIVQHAVPAIEWSEVAPLSCVKSVNVDAGFITWQDYEAVLRMLATDASADGRERVMQAISWFLMYRFGARSGEALGLRRKDLVLDGHFVIVLIRPNDYRNTKSEAGIRQVPLIGPLSDEEKSLLETWLDHVDEYAQSDWLGPLFAQQGARRTIVDTDTLVRRIGEALRAVTGNDRIRPHHARHSFGTRLEWLMSLDDESLGALPQDVVERVLGPCRPAQTRKLLLDTEQLGKRAFWAAALAIGHASPDMTLRVYTHLTDILGGTVLGFHFDNRKCSVKRADWTYVSGTRRLPRRRKIEDGRAITLTEQVVRDVADDLKSIHAVTQARPPAGKLSKRKRGPIELTPELIDRALEFAHRRGRVDALPQRLMVPADIVTRLLTAELAVRNKSGYGVPDTRWAPATTVIGVAHSRASARSPSESRRVVAFFRSMTPLLRSQEFIELAAKACEAWMNRYRQDSTALVLAADQEVRDIAKWMINAGIPAAHIEIRVPPDGQDIGDLVHFLNSSGVNVNVSEYRGTVALARSSHARSARRRAALLLRENPVGPLTSMGQLHRILHVMASWLGANSPLASQEFN